MAVFLSGFVLGIIASTAMAYCSLRNHAIDQGDYDPEGRSAFKDFLKIFNWNNKSKKDDEG